MNGLNNSTQGNRMVNGKMEYGEIYLSTREEVLANGLEAELERFSYKLRMKGRELGEESFKESEEYMSLVRELNYANSKASSEYDSDDEVNW